MEVGAFFKACHPFQKRHHFDQPFDDFVKAPLASCLDKQIAIVREVGLMPVHQCCFDFIDRHHIDHDQRVVQINYCSCFDLGMMEVVLKAHVDCNYC